MAGDDSRAGADLSALALTPFHLDILARCDELAGKLEAAYADYRFNEVGALLYDFLWAQFCDKFVEAVKGDLRDDASAEATAATLAVFDSVMARYLQCLHPYMPHLTEELSARMGYLAKGEFLMQKELPKDGLLDGIDADVVAAGREQASAIYETAGRLRNVKAEYRVAARKDVKFIAKSGPDWLEEQAATLALLVGAESITRDTNYDPPQGTPGAVTEMGELFMPMEGLIDVEAEKARLDKEIEKTEKEITKCENKLGNERFVANAKPEVVSVERERLAEWQGKLEQLQGMRDSLI
ncbi:MAG: class I tRNA ligase family protein [Akkermansiaceae bacterium]